MTTAIWPVLESLPGPLAAWITWRDRLAPCYDAFKAAFLKPVPDSPLESVPCYLGVQGCGCEHHVVPAPNGTLHGLCHCGHCESFTVLPEDLIPLDLDWPRLARALCAALGLPYKFARPGPYNTFQIGRFETLPVLLTVQSSAGEFLHVLTALVAKLNQPFILLSPTAKHHTPAARQLLQSIGAACFPLENHVAFDPKSGQLSTSNFDPSTAFGEIAPALEIPPPPPDEETTQRAFTLIEQLSAGDRSQPPTVLTVFRLYCLKELSIPQIARRCRCSTSTVANRLRLIRDKTGRDPLDYRRFSAQFATFDRDLTAAKRNYSRRHPLPFLADPDEDR